MLSHCFSIPETEKLNLKLNITWRQVQGVPYSSLCVRQGHRAFALLLSPLQGNISPAEAGERQKAQVTHQAWHVETKYKHLSLTAISGSAHMLGGQLLLPCQVYDRSCLTLPCDAGRGLSSIVSAKDMLPIPLGKQIFVLSEAIPLLLLQNHQFWPPETLPQGEDIPFLLK